MRIYNKKNNYHLRSKESRNIFGFYLLVINIVLSLVSNSVASQNSDIQFRNPNIQLSDNGVRIILEDDKGFMWFGCESGLNRYDGTTNNIYSRINGDSTSLSNNSVYAMCLAENGELWVGTNFGLNLYIPSENSFKQFYYNRKHVESLNRNYVRGIVEDADGDIWLATLGGICLVDRKNQQIVDFSSFTGVKQSMSNIMIRSLMRCEDDRILAGSNGGVVLELNKHTGDVIPHYFDNGRERDTNDIVVLNFNRLDDGIIWVGTLRNGLFKILDIRDGHIWYEQFRLESESIKSINVKYVSGVCRYDSTNILVGTENGGLDLFNTKTFESEIYQKGQGGNTMIGGNSIWSIYKDTRGLIWLGIFNVGINIIDSIPKKFKSYKNVRFNNKSVTHSAITSFVESSHGNMWITSDGGGLDYWDRQTNVFSHFRYNEFDDRTILSDAGLCLCKIGADELWVGSYDGGVGILNTKGEVIRNLTMEDGLSSNNVFSIVEAKNGRVYIATHGGGLDEYDPELGEIYTYLNDSTLNSAVRDIYINILYEDNYGNLWVGFNNAGIKLMKVTPKGLKEVKSFENNKNADNGISNNSVLAIAEDLDENVWVGTRDGLNRYTRKTDSFKVFRIEDGLPSNAIVGIVVDDENKIWISTLNGMSVFDQSSASFTNYNDQDGIQGKQFSNRSAYYKNSLGEIFFGGNEGFTMFVPDDIQYDRDFQKVYLVGLKLFNKKVSVGDSDAILSQHIMESEQLVFNHKQSVFTLEYVALNYSSPEKIKYAYWLEGVDKGWNFVDGKRTATYTNLDAGQYVFHIKSTNVEGEWNEDETQIGIEVLPPWWEKLLVRIVFVLIVAIVLYVIYLRKVSAIKSQKNHLEKMVVERTGELYESNACLEEINQEVFQQKEELVAQTDALAETNKMLEQSKDDLSVHKNNLEEEVKSRTAQLEKAKRKAEESERLKTAFLANISHEIRTPMNAIVGFSNLLKQKDITQPLRDGYIDQVSVNTNSLLSLIDDILDLSMMETTNMKVKNKEFALNDLLEEVFTSVIVVNKTLKLKLNNEAKEKELLLNSDRYRIKQILLNLFNNALKFTEQGFVELGCELNEEHLVLYVEDTGIGISEVNLELIFNRFRKITDNNAKLFRGAGLGLAISKKIADLLDAKLAVRSIIGEGAFFSLTFPRSIINDDIVSEERQNSTMRKEYEWSKKRLLIVEDEENNFIYLENVLQKTNINITWVQNGMEAVKLFELGSIFDLVLMDIKMPVMNGYDATRAIKKLNSSQLVIALTAHVRLRDGDDPAKLGFANFIVKPVLPDSLLKVLSKHL